MAGLMTPTDERTCRTLTRLLRAAGKEEEALRWRPWWVIWMATRQGYVSSLQTYSSEDAAREAILAEPEYDPETESPGRDCAPVTTDESLYIPLARDCEKAGLGWPIVIRGNWDLSTYPPTWRSGNEAPFQCCFQGRELEHQFGSNKNEGGSPSLALCAAIEAAGGGE